MVELEDVDPQQTLLWYTRHELQLTGSKYSCGIGGCGACTVMISTVNRRTSKLHHYTVNACIYPLVCVHGKAVTTVEGIGSTRTVLHPVQERLAKCHGTQCGFCSPGMVMSMYTVLRNTSKPTESQIMDALQGNLCRCTGYRPILDSFKTFVEEGCPLGEDCCKNNISKDHSVPQKLLYDTSSFIPLHETQEIIFPCELQVTDVYDKESLVFKKNCIQWFRPATMDEALSLMKTVPNCEWAMGHTLKRLSYKNKKNIIAVGHLQELQGIDMTDNALEIGAGITLSELQTYCQHIKNKKKSNTLIAESLLGTFSNWRSGKQIKNIGTLAGNVMFGLSTSNFIPMLMLLKAEAVFTDGENEYFHKINSDFVRREKNGQLLKKIRIPQIQDELIGYYYAAQQTHLAGRSSIVSGAFRAKFNRYQELISLSCAFGGIGSSSVLYDNILSKRHWNKEIVQSFCHMFNYTTNGHLVNKVYEKTVAFGFFNKFCEDVEYSLQNGVMHGFVSSYENQYTASGIHVWEAQSDRKSVGQPIPTQWSLEHVTGEAKYVMDMSFKGELHMVLVTSNKAHANILSIDASKALAIPGVVDFISHKDIFGNNILLPGYDDEEIFASKKVTHYNHYIGGIVAETAEAAIRGGDAVIIEYEPLPAIFTVDEAIDKDSLLFPKKVIEHGNITLGFNISQNILEGELELGGNEHYYMETHSTIVVPKQEYLQYDVYCTTQDQHLVQKSIGLALGIPQHKINVHTKRVGGAFGGKSFRSVLTALPAAIAAHKLNKPVRLTLDRALDMSTTGGRHPCYVKYRVGFDNEGKILAFDSDIYLNGGDSLDSTHIVLRKAMLKSDNCIKIPNVRITGYACKTNVASNTTFRGVGCPQAILVINTCAERIAKQLKMDTNKVYEINFIKNGDLSLNKQPIENCNIQKCWDMLEKSAGYVKQKALIAEFNKNNISKKKGIAMIPLRFDISYALPFCNQGVALVNIYTDGSVLVHHGGIEMGQGINIKMIQIASETLGVHHSKVIVDEVSTNTTPNAIHTGASSATDIFGGAVKDACDKLNKSLQPLRDRYTKASWEELVESAFKGRVPLSATGYCKPPGLWYDEERNEGHTSMYTTFGAACSEIELDVLTGEHKMVKTDIVFDIGKSINPAIDIGQIEGGFLQGYGYYCGEELLYSPTGELLTTGPSSYRVPTVRDIPRVLNISLLKDLPNEKAVYCSKGIGEPPLLLASSVFFAIKDAITSVRNDNGLSGDFQLNSPASPKKVLEACRS